MPRTRRSVAYQSGNLWNTYNPCAVPEKRRYKSLTSRLGYGGALRLTSAPSAGVLRLQLASWQGREDSRDRRFPVQLDGRGSSALESATAHVLTLAGGEGRLSRDCDAGSPATATRSVRDGQSSVRANERPRGRRAEINSSHGTHIRSFTAPSLITCWQTADSTDGKRGETRAGAGGRGGTSTLR